MTQDNRCKVCRQSACTCGKFGPVRIAAFVLALVACGTDNEPSTMRDAEHEQALVDCAWSRNCVGGNPDLAECADERVDFLCFDPTGDDRCGMPFDRFAELRACLASVNVDDCSMSPPDCVEEVGDGQ